MTGFASMTPVNLVRVDPSRSATIAGTPRPYQDDADPHRQATAVVLRMNARRHGAHRRALGKRSSMSDPTLPPPVVPDPDPGPAPIVPDPDLPEPVVPADPPAPEVPDPPEPMSPNAVSV